MYDDEVFNEMMRAMKKPYDIASQILTLKFHLNFLTNKPKPSPSQKTKFTSPSVDSYIKKNGFLFTGQFTDISVAADPGIPSSAIESIDDTEIKSAVRQMFSKSVENGYMTYDIAGDTFSLTAAGKEITQKNEFYEQFIHHQLTARERLIDAVQFKNTAQIQLNCTASDISVFNYTDSLNTDHIFNMPSEEAHKKLQAVIRQWKADGLVTQTGNILKPTEKGLDAAKQTSAAVKVCKTASDVRQAAQSTTAVGVVVTLTQKAAAVLKNSAKVKTPHMAMKM